MNPGIESSRLVALATSPEVQQATGLAARLHALTSAELLEGYNEVVSLAPRRAAEGRAFFVDRPQFKVVDRAVVRETEDLLEIALVNSGSKIEAAAASIDILMRQFPLFTSDSRRGVRAVDLIGHGASRFWVIELKAQPDSAYGETPQRALLEALIYSAIVEANADDIASELHRKYGLQHNFRRPGIVIAAPSAYWDRWKARAPVGEWFDRFSQLVNELSTALEVPFEVLDLGAVTIVSDADGVPRIASGLETRPVEY